MQRPVCQGTLPEIAAKTAQSKQQLPLPVQCLAMKRMLSRLLILGLAAVHLLPQANAHAPEFGRVEAIALARQIVPPGKNGAGWGADVHGALQRNGIRTTRSNFCAVMAVIEQESTYTANPEVNGLGAMAEKEIAARLSGLPLPQAAVMGVRLFLASKPTPERSYLTLIRAARTERDLDLVFRNLAFFLFREYASTRLLNTAALARRVDAVNPVSTLGSMQVSIAYVIAEVEKARGRRLGMPAIWKLRDELYTRRGGVNYGTRMLLGYRAGYASRLHVFADYNAGRYASRNAAFQHMVATLSGHQLALDGDLLIYEGAAPKPSPSATERALRSLGLPLNDKAIRAGLLKEKESAFRDGELYGRVASAYAAKTGKAPPHAMVPQIRLESPKLSKHMTTERFARAVMRRYERCMNVR
jgi:hypothetical protein